MIDLPPFIRLLISQHSHIPPQSGILDSIHIGSQLIRIDAAIQVSGVAILVERLQILVRVDELQDQHAQREKI